MSEVESGEIESVAVVPVEARALGRPLLEHEPAVVLREAQKAAAALQDVLARKEKKVVMNGEQYLEFEDWQTVGRFYGVTAREDGDPEYVEIKTGETVIRGFKASALAVRNGEVISRATAYCLSDEPKWDKRTKHEWHYVLHDGSTQLEDPGKDGIVWEPNPAKPGKKRPRKVRVQMGDEQVPLFQLASMAQTRAAAKTLRNVLSWVVVLAGYRPTPAEEIDATASTVENGSGAVRGAARSDGEGPHGPEPSAGPHEIPDGRTYASEPEDRGKVTQKETEALVKAVILAGFPQEPVEGRKGAVFPGWFLESLGLGGADKLMPLYLFCQNRRIYEGTMKALAAAAPQKEEPAAAAEKGVPA